MRDSSSQFVHKEFLIEAIYWKIPSKDTRENVIIFVVCIKCNAYQTKKMSLLAPIINEYQTARAGVSLAVIANCNSSLLQV